MGLRYSRCEAAPAAAAPSSALSKEAEAIQKAIQEASKEVQQSLNRPWYQRIERTYLPNPGSYEDLNLEATMVLRPNFFDGFQFNVMLPVSPVFQVGHSWNMGSHQIQPNYAFSANYFSNQLVMMSRLDPFGGRVNGRIFINHTPSLTSKIMADVGSEPHSSKGTWDLDYRGSDSCAQLKVGNGGIVAVSYLQSITPTISMGGEGFYQGKNRFSAITAAIKYNSKTDVASFTMASFGPIILSYLRKVSARCSLATELFWDMRGRDTMLTVGYRYDLNKATLSGQIDSNGRVAGYIEEKLNPGLSLLLSGELDHSKAEYKFGFGIQIGQ